jgi:hypothetical protein
VVEREPDPQRFGFEQGQRIRPRKPRGYGCGESW